MSPKRRNTDKPSVKSFLKETSSLLGYTSIIIGIIYGAFTWYNNQIITNHNTNVKLIKNVEDIKDLNSNLKVISHNLNEMIKKNDNEHIEIKSDINHIKESVDNFDKKLNLLLIQRKVVLDEQEIKVRIPIRQKKES